jgi:hypothetical protein
MYGVMLRPFFCAYLKASTYKPKLYAGKPFIR